MILTILYPFLLIALMLFPSWLSSLKSNQTHTIAIVDATGKYAPLFQDSEAYHFFYSDKHFGELLEQSREEGVYAILNITDDLLYNPNGATLYSGNLIKKDLEQYINQTLSKQLEKDKLASYQIPGLEQLIKDSRISYEIETIQWENQESESASSGLIAYSVGLFTTVLIYFFILKHGFMVMQAVLEEKANRIVEIMVTSVKPFSLMMGKIIGIGLVGITQIFLWSILTVLIMLVGGFIGGDVSGGIESMQTLQETNSMLSLQSAPHQQGLEWFTQFQVFYILKIISFFFIYFLGGYLLYASLFASIGAAVNSSEDVQQFVRPISLLLIFALYVGIYSLYHPYGNLAVWGSIIPFTSPIVMMMRVSYDLPLWEIILSIVLLYGTAIASVWVSGKIYRMGILMYGKKPRMKEIIKWITFE